MSASILRNGNEIKVEGDLDDFHYFLSSIHGAIEKAGYRDITLNLSNCSAAFQNSMLSVCAQICAYREQNVHFHLIPPENKKLHNLFKNTGWAHFIDPRQYDPSIFKGHSRIPATAYKNSSEQQIAVNKIVNVLLGAIPDMQRADFAALEWAINEITDNVLVHSDSSIGGLVQVSTFERITKQVQFVVADAGIGIPTSLRQGHPDINSDIDALDKAIKEGVTRDKRIGQGNGLFGTYEICSKSGGNFSLYSGHAKLEYHPKKGLSIGHEKIPYAGTLVVATIDFSQSHLLENALQFKGKKHLPLDYIETRYETSNDGKIHFILKDESSSYGSRVAGKPIRQKLSNLLRMSNEVKIVIDLDDIPLISSSFADEAFAKLYLEAGTLEFMKKFEFTNVTDTVQQLINRAISQRVSVGVLD